MRHLLMTTITAISLALSPVAAKAQADDVEQRVHTYLDRMFAPNSKGIFVERSGILHRMTPPFIVAYYWPTCEDKISGILDRFEDRTGVHIYTDRDDLKGLFGGTDLKFNILYMEYPDFNTYLNRNGHAYMKRVFRREDITDINNDIKDGYENGIPTVFKGSDQKQNKSYLIEIIPTRSSQSFGCDVIVHYSLIELISNLPALSFSHEFDDLDFSFIRAINDPSIDANEAEDRAKEKLFILMTNDLKGQKNAEHR